MLRRIPFLLFLFLILKVVTGEAKEPKRCLGTNSAFSIAEDRMDHLNKLITRYTNCTIVQGNLEITGLEDQNIDASFFQDIEVVTGYVLIAINYIKYIPLENLKIIRGQELYGSEKLALNIAVNYNRDEPAMGLRQLGFKALTEIQQGNVAIVQNNRMCFIDTIDWKDIMNPRARKEHGWKVAINNTVHASVGCEKCHPTCNGHCWGPKEDQCQRLTSSICHNNCGDSRCRGAGADECCDRECACGCIGPTDRDCIACLHMNNSGVCQRNCPPRFTYDQQTSRYVTNPNFKYHFNEMCVDKCPNNMLVEDNGCVKHCRKGQHNNGSGVCVQCNGNECNKECFGVGNPDGPLNQSETIDSKNVHFFEGCNIVRGNVIFQAYAFSGDDHTNTPPMTAEQVVKAFSAVKIVNGYLKILSWPKQFEDFSVFSNLTTIIGIDLFRDVVGLLIQDSITVDGPFHLSQIRSLGFRSLESIMYGNVYIGYMQKLCYQDLVNWQKIIKNPVVHSSFEDGLLLRENTANCETVFCHPACDNSGCWGQRPQECLACRNLTYDGLCVTGCDRSLGIYQDGNKCLSCNEECTDTCEGSGPDMCTSCKHYDDEGVCVNACPPDKYGDLQTKECLPCNVTCIGQGSRSLKGAPMCSGPNSTLALGGCEYCFTVMADRDLRIQECLPRSQTTCPKAHYIFENVNLQGTERACVPCIEGCQNCTGSSEKDCLHSLPVKSDTAVIMAVVVTIVALGLVCLIAFLFHHRKQKIRRKRQMSMRALGLEGGAPEPMTPSGVAPNQAQLRIVKETELRIGKILGSGAFGTVHNGYWIPDLAPREKVRVPVAIKVLRDESSQVASNEILDEAFVMASCEHPNLVRLLGISLSQKIMLITQLMPLGNLLEYVRDNKDNIGSQTLLNWCFQIAKGMCYLAEEKHLVHRDLAARNVLVKSPNHVRITDFGLAKLLDVNEDVYRAEGGKMPIKWLALESIQHRLFTQKSDVWSFGVTVWELMTFGKKPYENVPAREVHTLLERGQRLLQPSTCTIDVYMLMIKCWTVDPESRPTFRELVEDFSKMARDPQRYLVIANDSSLSALPSPTTSEFFRSLKYEEDDDFPLQDAEEYLQPAPDSFDQATANNGHFSLQPAPLTAQWRKQQPMEDPRSTGRFGTPHQSSSTVDSRLDSAITVMTSLPSESAYPNGCSTPFGVNTPGGNMTPRSLRNGFPAFGRSSNRMMHDQLPGTSGRSSLQASNIGPRTQSESSDVFINSPSGHHRDGPIAMSHQTYVHDHPGIIRARENSAAKRYCDDPILSRQGSRPNGNDGHSDLPEDQDGYLEPTDVAKRSPDYLEPITYSNSSPYFARVTDRRNPFTRQVSRGMENPEYEPTFTPTVRNGFSAGSHNLVGRQSSIPFKEDDGYEVPMAGAHEPHPYSERRLSTEYENINTETGLPSLSGDLEEDEHGYLAVNHRMLPRRRGSHSGESTSSEKRDSGLQSEGDEDSLLHSKNVRAADDAPGNDVSRNRVTSESSACEKYGVNHNVAVDNPNYELLEDMTDGGFRPMSDFKPRQDDPWELNVDFVPPPPFPNSITPPRTRGPYRNALQSTIDCNGCDDTEDNIFVTPESKRRDAAAVQNLVNGDEAYEIFATTPETRRRNLRLGKLSPEYDDLVGKSVPRTYSEPDSGVGIEVGIDNMLYHRLGSSGCEGSD